MVKDIIATRIRVRSILVRPDEIIDWGLESLGIPELWRQSQGEGIKIAILDTGLDSQHPDLEGAVVGSKDFTKIAIVDGQSACGRRQLWHLL